MTDTCDGSVFDVFLLPVYMIHGPVRVSCVDSST